MTSIKKFLDTGQLKFDLFCLRDRKEASKNGSHCETKKIFMAINFNWHSDTITAKTRIDGNYRNTQNVRRYFMAQCDGDFKFDRPFMAWMKASIGKSMKDSVAYWKDTHCKQA